MRIVVVSPHLDDAVLSLGAGIASWARRGARVEVLTVFACDPDSDAPAGGWDRRGGFATEGEAARARREEDRRALAILGASPVWLPFGSVDFDRHGDETDVREAIRAVTQGADELLLPGHPLSHPDHAWLAGVLDGAELGGGRLRLYAEQPYTRRAAEAPPPSFEPAAAGLRDRLAKWRAIRQYRSQLALLGLTDLRRGPHTLLRPERVAWAAAPVEPGSV
jgi:LmbE family N-acetylglucosaminyl deacetylase